MSIKNDVYELESIRNEIKVLNIKRKKLKEKEKQVEIRISEYLKSKEQPGVKYQGTAILLEEKEKPLPKKAKERDMDSISVLEKYGIENPDKVLKELLNARKGDKIVKESLRITKYKGN